MSGIDAQIQTRPKSSLLKRILTTIVGVSYFLAMCFWGTLPFCVGVTITVALGIFEFVDAYNRSPPVHLPPTPAIHHGAAWFNPAIAWSFAGGYYYFGKRCYSKSES